MKLKAYVVMPSQDPLYQMIKIGCKWGPDDEQTGSVMLIPHDGFDEFVNQLNVIKGHLEGSKPTDERH